MRQGARVWTDDPGEVEYFEAVRDLLGERVGECRYDQDRGLRATIIGLTQPDREAIEAIAARFGFADRVRIEDADPTHLATWERLRHDLEPLFHRDPHVITVGPTPSPGYRRPPMEIDLAAHAEATASELHAGYGDFVQLRVGALPYPPGRPETRRRARPVDRWPTIGSDEARFEFTEPVRIVSGHSGRRLVRMINTGVRPITVRTNGQLRSYVVDDHGGRVGAFSGPQPQPLVIFTAEPDENVIVPVLIGTASLRTELGYAVPPGRWDVTLALNLDDGRTLESQPLAITIDPP